MARSLALALLLGLPACAGTEPARRPCLPAAALADHGRFLDARAERYQAAIRRARAWLDALSVDPFALRARGIKGKKKLTELLDGYHRLHAIAGPGDREAILARVREVAAPTYEDRYHDLPSLGERELREDATSYLRAAWLLDRMGLDTRRHRAGIAAAKERLDAHLASRGPQQRRAFHTYYQHFGLRPPFDLGRSLDEGIVAKKPDPGEISRVDLYLLTHEVFAAYAYGDDLAAAAFGEADLAYLRRVIAIAVPGAIARRDPDLCAELVASARYLGIVDAPAYAQGIDFLLASQNADGSWGAYEAQRRSLGEYVKQGFLLHTTVVAVEALTAAFAAPFRRELGRTCAANTLETAAPPRR